MEITNNRETSRNSENREEVVEDCRICLKKCTQICRLFQSDTSILKKLVAFAAVEVQEGDGLPNAICLPCSRLLDISYNFRCQIKKSDIKLRMILRLKTFTERDAKKDESIVENFLNDISNTVLQKKCTGSVDINTEEVNNSMVESIVQFNIPAYTNDQNFTSDTVVSGTKSRDNNKPEIISSNQNKLQSNEIAEKTNFQSYIAETNILSDQVTLLSTSSVSAESIKKEISLQEEVEASKNGSDSADRNLIHEERIFKLEIKSDIPADDITDNMHSQEGKNVDINETTKPSDICSDDEEKPLICRTSRQKCPHCIKSFATRLAIQRHMIVHKHKTKLRYVCYICDKQFSNIGKLKNHIFNKHDTYKSEKKAKINRTDKEITSKTRHVDRNYNNSIKNSDSEKKNLKFTCKICSKQFTYQKSFLTHAKSHSEYKFEPSDSCTYQSVDKSKEIKDISTFKVNESEEGTENDNITDSPIDNLQCTQCGKLFATKRNLKRHISTHSGLKYNCSTCGKGFSRIDKLKDHKQSKHKEEIFGNSNDEDEDDTDNENKINGTSEDRKKDRHNRPHKCVMCSKAFVQQQSLVNHIERHKRAKDTQKRFLCEVCSKCFAQSGSLVAHMRTHTGIKPYVCNVCSRAFTKSTYLQLHLRTHSGEKPYICQYCSRAFARANTLARHITMHTGEAKYHCQICTKSFRRLTSLNEHTYTHTGQRPYACKICTKRYNNAGSLYAHTKKCKAQQLSTTTMVCNVPVDNTAQQNDGPISQVLIYSQRKLVEDAIVGQVTPTPQYMIANVHNQKALPTNIMQPFSVEDPNVYTVNSKQLKNYYSIYPNM